MSKQRVETWVLIVFLWQVFQEAAWPGIVVLLAHGILGEICGHEPYIDPATHFLGGVAAAFFFIRSPRLAPQWFGEPTRTTLYLLGFGLTCAIALFWEFGEFLSDVFLGTRIQRTVGNTLRDLFNGMFGAIVFISSELFLGRRSPPNSRF